MPPGVVRRICGAVRATGVDGTRELGFRATCRLRRGRHPALRRGMARGFWFGGFFHTLGSDGARGFDFLFWRTLLPFVLRVVAGACVGRRSGQPRMPPRERQHEELGGLGVPKVSGIRAASGEGEDGTRGLVFGPGRREEVRALTTAPPGPDRDARGRKNQTSAAGRNAAAPLPRSQSPLLARRRRRGRSGCPA